MGTPDVRWEMPQSDQYRFGDGDDDPMAYRQYGPFGLDGHTAGREMFSLAQRLAERPSASWRDNWVPLQNLEEFVRAWVDILPHPVTWQGEIPGYQSLDVARANVQRLYAGSSR